MAVHSYSTRSIAGNEILLDEEKYLVHPEQWSKEFAEEMACEEGPATLTDRHWEVIRFIRDFYLQNGRSPLHKELRKATGISMMELERLFPGGIRHGARRLAGLPNPKLC